MKGGAVNDDRSPDTEAILLRMHYFHVFHVVHAFVKVCELSKYPVSMFPRSAISVVTIMRDMSRWELTRFRGNAGNQKRK